MSGIAGVLRRDGRPIDPSVLERMGERLAHRGPDASGTWSGESAGLVHRMLRTTPESLGESQPAVLGRGELVAVADLRLDNRDPLLLELGAGAGGGSPPGDAEIVLRAYARWGEGCAERLVGDFAFAIWDGPGRRLFAARDPFGVRPLYYFDTGPLFAFASEIKALLALGEVPPRLSDLRVAYYLAGVTEDEAPTFYERVLRLPAGHSMVADAGGIRIRRHHAIEPERRLPRASEEEHCRAFRERFVEAVRSRLRSAFPVGALLSGGLDSSSVVCVARELLASAGKGPLRTFSVVFDGAPESDERPFIEAVLAGGDVEPRFVRGDLLDPFGEWETFLWHQDEACYGGNLFLNRAVYRAARDEGVRVLLDGLDGDSVVGYGLERLAELARRGRWIRTAREIGRLSKRLGKPAGSLLRRFVARPLLEEAAGLLPLRVREAVGRRRGGTGARPDALGGALLHPDLSRRLSFPDRVRSLREPIRARLRGANAPQQCHAFLSGMIPAALEVLDRLATGLGIRPAYPFLDRRLVEFCLALPADLKLRDGWTRYVERIATPSLPDLVRWRDWKGNLAPNFTRALATYDGDLVRRVVRGEGFRLEGLVDEKSLRRVYDRFLADGRPRDAFELSKAVGLALWLKSPGGPS